LLHDATHVLIMRIGLQQNSGPVYETAMVQLNNVRGRRDTLAATPDPKPDGRLRCTELISAFC
jgi:hypothetical protein